MCNTKSTRPDLFLFLPTKGGAQKFRNFLWKRYTKHDYPTEGDLRDMDRLTAYMERIIDRLINKGRGVLPFNSLLLVLYGIESRQIDLGLIGDVTLGCAALSGLLILILFLVHWGNIDHYGEIAKEIDVTVKVIRVRSYILQMAIWLSFVSLGGITYIAFRFAK